MKAHLLWIGIEDIDLTNDPLPVDISDKRPTERGGAH